MPAIVFPEWIDNNEKVKYPFSDSATLQNSEGDFLPDSIFLDARLYPIGGSAQQYISKITVTSATVSIIISDSIGELAVGEFSIAAPPDTLALEDGYERPAGVLVSTSSLLSVFSGWGIGEHLFELSQTEFAASVVVPVPQIGLRGFLLEDGTFFSKDVHICGTDGVVVNRDTDGSIRIDVIGEPLYIRKVCEEAGSFVTPRFVQTINGISPDEYGNYNLYIGNNIVDDPILRFEYEDNSLRLTLAGILLSDNSQISIGEGVAGGS
jgi:hypothetical protein